MIPHEEGEKIKTYISASMDPVIAEYLQNKTIKKQHLYTNINKNSKYYTFLYVFVVETTKNNIRLSWDIPSNHITSFDIWMPPGDPEMAKFLADFSEAAIALKWSLVITFTTQTFFCYSIIHIYIRFSNSFLFLFCICKKGFHTSL